jgi:TonB-linked SusC/RagA family outer membrane protein
MYFKIRLARTTRKKWTTILLLVVVGCMPFLTAYSQEIKGVVVDNNGEPLVGATVIVVDGKEKVGNLNITTSVTADGKYSIRVPNANFALEFRYIGFVTQIVPVSETKTLSRVVMQEDATTLGEVVIVAYGTQLKRNVTGSIASVNEFSAEKTQVGNVLSGLQGRVPGLTIRRNDGSPGSPPQFVIRGYQANSLRQFDDLNNVMYNPTRVSNAPLIVVDGLIVDNNDNFTLANIAPQDIKSIEVLKDAASSAMYGSRGAMGVIQITTKKGAFNSRPVVNFSSYYGFVKTPLNYRLLNSPEYAEVFREGRKNRIADINGQIAGGGLTPGQIATLQNEVTKYNDEINALNMGDSSVNWLDEVIPDNAVKSDIHLSLSGGNAKSTYYFSLGKNSEDYSIGTGNFTRYNTKLALTTQAYDWLKLSADIAVTRSTNKNFTDAMTVLNSAWVRPDTPKEPKYNADGTWGYYFGSQQHPLLVLQDNNNSAESTNTTGKFGADVNLIKGLVWTSTAIGTLSDKKTYSFYSPESYNGEYYNGEYFEHGSDGHRITANSFLNYNIDINKLNIAATLGYEYNENKQNNYVTDIYEFPTIEGLEAPANGASFGWSGYIANNNRKLDRSESYFVRTNLHYDRRYLLGLSVRRDGTSRLVKEHRYSNFPAVSAGWIISEENFMSEQTVINFMKLRSSFGITGSITGVLQTDTYDLLQSGVYYDNPALVVKNAWGNPYLQWEKTEQTDIGLDALLLNNKLDFAIDWYYKYTDGILVSEPLPSTTGGYTTRKVNSGTIRNRGFDIALNYNSSTNDFTYGAGFNVNINRSKVLALPVDEQYLDGGYYGGGNQPRPRLKVGEPLGGLYLYQALGIDENGDVIYFDKNGSGGIDANDMLIVSNLQPKFNGGLNFNVGWKDFSLLGQFAYSYGNKVYNVDEQLPRALTLSSGVMRNMPDYVLDRWTPENNNSRYPRFVVGVHGPQNEAGWNDKPSTLYLFDASYLKLGKLTLSYGLPKSLISKLTITKCLVYLSGENIWTLKNKELHIPDPEAALNSGIAQKAIPAPRNILVGIDLTF